jgi:hypothetical protein
MQLDGPGKVDEMVDLNRPRSYPFFARGRNITVSVITPCVGWTVIPRPSYRPVLICPAPPSLVFRDGEAGE